MNQAGTTRKERSLMTTVQHQRSAMTHHERLAIGAMYVGLGLTVAAIIVLHVDHVTGNALVRHVRAGYPSYGQVRIDTAVTTYLIYLSVLGALGVLCWLFTIWAVSTRRAWARWVATALFAAGTGIALFNLLVRDTSGDTGLPPLLGWVGMLPSIAGLLAVIFLWKRPSRGGESVSPAAAVVSR
jgi:hypothetical protein